MDRRKKREDEQKARELTRKEIRQSHRDRERNRKLMIWVGVALGLAALVIVWGLVSEFVLKPSSAIAQVGDTKITVRDFWKRVHLQQNQLRNQLVNLTNLEQQFGGQGFFTAQINQLQSTLSSPFSLGSQVENLMVDEVLIRREAAARGLTVSDEEVDARLREQVASGKGAVTEPQATATAEGAIAATATATSWTPTPTPTIDISATVTATATAVATPVPPPTLPILTDEGYTTGLADVEKNLQDVAGMSLAEYREVLRAQLLREKLSEAIGTEKVATTQEEVHARHILLRVITPTPSPTPLPEGFPTPEPTLTPTPLPEGFPTPTPTPALRDDAATLALANELRQRILAGEDFATLAAQYSDDPGSGANGGDLGWFARGAMVAPFDDAAFSLPLNQVSEPVKSDFGYHLIEVLEKDANRPKEESALQQERQQAFDTWLKEQEAMPDIQRSANLASLLPSDLNTNILAPVATP
jgi:hypothetical protein